MATNASINFTLIGNEAGDAAHLYPPGHEHDTDARDCWCHPTFYAVCDCEDGCWKCDADAYARQLTPQEAAMYPGQLLVVHR